MKKFLLFIIFLSIFTFIGVKANNYYYADSMSVVRYTDYSAYDVETYSKVVAGLTTSSVGICDSEWIDGPRGTSSSIRRTFTLTCHGHGHY